MCLDSLKKKVYKQGSLLIFTGLVAACPQISLADNLLDLWRIAELKDAKYLSAYHKYLSDKEIIELSRGDLLPDLSFRYEHKITDQTINESDNIVYNSDDDQYTTKSYGLTLRQSVFDYARWQRFSQSEISVDRAEVEYSLAKQELLMRLSENYFIVLERGDQLETVQAEKAAMRKHLDVSEKKHKSGLGNKADVEDARARYLNALSKEVELQSRLSDSRYALRVSLGSMPGELSKLRPKIDLELPIPNDPEEWVSISAKNNLELQSIKLALDVANREINAVRGGHYPTLDLVASMDNTVADGSVYGGGSDIDNTNIMLQLNVPLYSGGKTSSKLRAAIEKRNSIFEDRNDKQRIVEREAHDAYHRISTAIVQIEALEQSVKARDARLKSKTSGYRVGKDSMLQVLDAEQDFSEARQALTKARYDYVLNILKLKFSAGDLQESDLAAINGWLMAGSQATL
ncbi:MAG: TolC family outer membrane protein [Actinobacteria bacterium]|nr:TolC family outer membrane protein [Actinomycetota bacterium]